MASAVALRDDFTAARVRALARSSRDANQVRRLLALAMIYEGGTRSEAAQLGGVGLQTVRDWVLRFNAAGPDGLIDAVAPGGVPLLDDAQRRALAVYRRERPDPGPHPGPDPGIARRGTLVPDRSGAVGVGRVCHQYQQADAEPGASRHGISQAVGASAPSCAR